MLTRPRYRDVVLCDLTRLMGFGERCGGMAEILSVKAGRLRPEGRGDLSTITD